VTRSVAAAILAVLALGAVATCGGGLLVVAQDDGADGAGGSANCTVSPDPDGAAYTCKDGSP
jgi:hypothetical protein